MKNKILTNIIAAVALVLLWSADIKAMDKEEEDRRIDVGEALAHLRLVSNVAKTLINTQPQEMKAKLRLAAKTGNKRMVERLIREGVDINTSTGTDAKTPLMLAAEYGHTPIVQMLLNLKSNLDSNELERAQDLATKNGHEGIEQAIKQKCFLIAKGQEQNRAQTREYGFDDQKQDDGEWGGVDLIDMQEGLAADPVLDGYW